MLKVVLLTDFLECKNKLDHIGIFIQKNDVCTKEVFKKIKDIGKKEAAQKLFLWCKSFDDCKAVELVSSFFPNKMREVKEQGNFEITNFWYDESDEKIKATINQNGSERKFMLRTDNYEDRIKELINLAITTLTQEVGKLYGYFFMAVDNGWYITDKNLNKDGSYRKVLEFNSQFISYSKKFDDIDDIDKLIIYE